MNSQPSEILCQILSYLDNLDLKQTGSSTATIGRAFDKPKPSNSPNEQANAISLEKQTSEKSIKPQKMTMEKKLSVKEEEKLQGRKYPGGR